MGFRRDRMHLMRMRSISLVFLVGITLGLAAASCGNASACTSKSCAGCCDASGVCQLGTTAAACGVSGGSCLVCAGTTCAAGICKNAGSGGGTGAKGGGTGSTGGGSGGGVACRNIVSFPIDQVLVADYWSFTQSVGHYNLVRFSTKSAVGPGEDTLGLEVLYANDVGPMAPFSKELTTANYSQCSVCAVFYENCDPQHNCQRTYLGRSGSVSITRADRAAAGRMAGTASTLVFQNWDLDLDKSLGDSCILVGNLPQFNVGWNQDGGQPPP